MDTSRLYISDRAHLIMPYHVTLDALEERSKRRPGHRHHRQRVSARPTWTRQGRVGIRVGDLLEVQR